MAGRLSLRTRLVVGVLVLAAAGLAAADVATYTSLRSFLVARTDKSLDEDRNSFGGDPGPHRGPGPSVRAPPGVYAEIRSGDGTQVREVRTIQTFPGQEAASQPRLPDTISPPGSDNARRFTVPAASGGERFRVRASLDGRSGMMLVLATSLHDVDATLQRLLMIELLVTAAVLLALGLLGMWFVRLGLRPLREIEVTAGAIAAGDLSRRVERADERTEVGRLGLSLNAMLGHIESAFKAREESERKLRQFVADASHELRTPLAAVRAYAELFARGADRRPDDLARAMTGISRESERMSLLVQDLLLLARLDEGRPLEREEVRLDEVVGEAVDTARTVEPSRPIELESEGAVVLGDRDRLRQIVDNLLGNVRAHTPPAAPMRVTVGRTNGTVVVEVEDSGPGLSPDELEHVFERFYRADPSRSRAAGGVGLGLSIVAAVAQAHGGSVSASTNPERGATFRIALPLHAKTHIELQGLSQASAFSLGHTEKLGGV